MQYFEASDGKLERIGKVIGDTISALVILSVLILAFNIAFR
jgi:TRAP-type mannitol/chloroaromatic compound transport system permease small subunit